MTAAVLTADIVNSTQLPPDQSSELRRTLEVIFDKQRLEFYRGDSFQALIAKPGEALRAALQARSLARGLGISHDVRCSIGLGRVAGAAGRLATASDEAFVLSGRAFDNLGEERRLAIVSAVEEHNTALRLLAAYADRLFRQLTAKQASVVFELLSGRTQTEAAATLHVTQATVSSHAQSAGWTEIEYLLSEYEALCASLKN
ncbi:hypothetical protein [Flaviaesturariibacter aridisoli]|uniref:Uncharacterized protein n=1 Tax=Flaviaesturariibacter aridisoli TaxID=2545761 RepID=A0A4R4E0Z9_9BACT|nr:hypothetical protein [Flaviaesturariibacter aridisoli]TCZ68079.1 hypothetical protein E0486_14730 [Flaviaesturariibacter aridisoli]